MREKFALKDCIEEEPNDHWWQESLAIDARLLEDAIGVVSFKVEGNKLVFELDPLLDIAEFKRAYQVRKLVESTWIDNDER